MIPDLSEIPKWVSTFVIPDYSNIYRPCITDKVPLNMVKLKSFKIKEVFDVKKGKRLIKANMQSGRTPFVGAIDKNNGIRQYISAAPIHEGNTITVNYNGSVGEAYYQPVPFYASDDVNVLYPKFRLNKYIALFIVAIIKNEKYRYNYGRKWHMERMEESVIKLPVCKSGELDLNYMENYIKSLNYTSSI